MFNIGELIKRKALHHSRVKGFCVVVDKDKNNYTLYNNSLTCFLPDLYELNNL